MVAAVQKQYRAVEHNRYRLGIWVLLAAIVMLFTSLTSAYIVRAAAANDWRPLPLPRMLVVSTAVILLSSVTFELARRKLKAGALPAYSRWLGLTGVLGFVFLAGQLLAWRQLTEQGIRLASSARGDFFYLLAATHGVHLLGGLLALSYLMLRSRRVINDENIKARRRAIVDAASLYWHFMDGLWIYLFLLLFFWR
jgi:cytochrome c oxidase subunit III